MRRGSGIVPSRVLRPLETRATRRTPSAGCRWTGHRPGSPVCSALLMLDERLRWTREKGPRPKRADRPNGSSGSTWCSSSMRWAEMKKGATTKPRTGFYQSYKLSKWNANQCESAKASEEIRKRLQFVHIFLSSLIVFSPYANRMEHHDDPEKQSCHDQLYTDR